MHHSPIHAACAATLLVLAIVAFPLGATAEENQNASSPQTNGGTMLLASGGPQTPPPPGAMPGMPPMPPDGKMGPPPGGQPDKAELKGAQVFDSGNTTLDGRLFVSKDEDTSALWARKNGVLTLTNATVRTTGNTSSNDGSSFFGLNAAVLASEGGRITLRKGAITTTGSGANGLFATDKGSQIHAADLEIRAEAGGGHGAMTSNGGAIALERCSIFTRGAHGAPLATDRGGGSVSAVDCLLTAAGEGSPLLYSTGELKGTRLSGEAAISEAVVIEGKNSVTLLDCQLTGNKNGAMIYQSFSGDAQGFGGVLRMAGGSFAAGKGALFYVTNTTADVTLTGTVLRADSGVLARAASDRWGQSGKNGGTLRLKAQREFMKGDLLAQAGSRIEALLTERSTLIGRTDNVGLTLDSSSRWDVTGASSLISLTLTGGATLDQIQSNGFRLTYDPTLASNDCLGGKTHVLPGGGVLEPHQ